jgi:erythromycin esterase
VHPRLVLNRLTLSALALLLACGDGAVDPPVDGGDQLLTDEQLVTVADTIEASVNPAWEQWIRANHYTMRSLTSENTTDLQFLKTVIGNRRIVQLGESGHGVREFNQSKVRLIKFLHREMGYEVIAWESGLFECWKADELAATATARQTRSRCTFGVWGTEEVLELFEYIRETRGTSRPLILAGFDVQLTGSLARQHAPDLLADVVGRVNAALGARMRDVEIAFHDEYPAAVSGALFDRVALRASIERLEAQYAFTARYDSVVKLIDANAAALAAAYPTNPGAPLVARQLAAGRIRQLEGSKVLSNYMASTIRDRGMADNVDFLLEKLYPGKKIMIWAHNAHIMHDRASMTAPNQILPQSMGAYVAQRWRSQLYSIGLFMYRGTAANNGGIAYTVRRPLDGSLEALFYRARKRWVFVDMLSQGRSAGTTWMFDPIPFKEWGTNDYMGAPRSLFDGILFIDTVSPPKYLDPLTPGE